MGPYMEKNPDMSVDGQQSLTQYQENSSNLVRLQEMFDKTVDGFHEFKNLIQRNNQELGDVVTDIKRLEKYNR